VFIYAKDDITLPFGELTWWRGKSDGNIYFFEKWST